MTNDSVYIVAIMIFYDSVHFYHFGLNIFILWFTKKISAFLLTFYKEFRVIWTNIFHKNLDFHHVSKIPLEIPIFLWDSFGFLSLTAPKGHEGTTFLRLECLGKLSCTMPIGFPILQFRWHYPHGYVTASIICSSSYLLAFHFIGMLVHAQRRWGHVYLYWQWHLSWLKILIAPPHVDVLWEVCHTCAMSPKFPYLL